MNLPKIPKGTSLHNLPWAPGYLDARVAHFPSTQLSLDVLAHQPHGTLNLSANGPFGSHAPYGGRQRLPAAERQLSSLPHNGEGHNMVIT